jgi:hypothetical protein
MSTTTWPAWVAQRVPRPILAPVELGFGAADLVGADLFADLGQKALQCGHCSVSFFMRYQTAPPVDGGGGGAESGMMG